MSHSFKPDSNHSANLLATSSCNVPERVQSCRNSWKSGSLKKLFLVHGEAGQMQRLADDVGGIEEVQTPLKGQSFIV